MGKKIFIIIIGLVGIVIIVAVLGAWYFFSQVSAPASGSAEEKTVSIESGMGVKEIGQDLKEAGLIKNQFIFETYVYLEGVGDSLKAGEYKLNTGMNIREVVSTVFKGEALSGEMTIRIIEGWTSREIADHVSKVYFESNPDLDSSDESKNKYIEDFTSVVKTSDSRKIIEGKTYDFLSDKPSDQGLEGYLFPDTYRVFVDAAPAQVIEKMLDNFEDKFTDQMIKDIEAQGKTIFEIVTMASILEKEVRTKTEKKMAADLFYRRIETGIALQADATVTFILDKNTTALTNQDLEVDSPYNTYKYKGLPPGPITNPGLESIVAAIYPQANDYWYYLTKSDTGEAVFSKTLEEHNRNKTLYLK